MLFFLYGHIVDSLNKRFDALDKRRPSRRSHAASDHEKGNYHRHLCMLISHSCMHHIVNSRYRRTRSRSPSHSNMYLDYSNELSEARYEITFLRGDLNDLRERFAAQLTRERHIQQQQMNLITEQKTQLFHANNNIQSKAYDIQHLTTTAAVIDITSLCNAFFSQLMLLRRVYEISVYSQ
jgi:hypothetical protein